MADILLLAQDRSLGRDVRDLLRRDRHRVITAPLADGWSAREGEVAPEVIVAAVDEPDDVLAEAGAPVRGFPAPLLLVQRGPCDEDGPLLDDRLVDRMCSPFLDEQFLGRVDALVRVRRVLRRAPPAESRARWRSLRAALGRWFRSDTPGERPLGPYLGVAARIASWADRRDAFHPGHAERVTSLCAMIAETLHLDADQTTDLLRAALLHDIGKVALPVEILHQRTPLDDAQVRLIRTHPRRGASLLRALDPDEQVADAILFHHEHPDGSGYYGRSGNDIPRPARVLAVAEAFDGMTSTRLRAPFTQEEALERLTAMRDSRMDGESVDALVDRLKPRRLGPHVALSPPAAC
jgi:putative nucleotidyltransferase with HDIG domain